MPLRLTPKQYDLLYHQLSDEHWCTPMMLGGNVFGWTADEATSFAVLDAFVAQGGNSLDTADVYSAWAPGHSGGESETGGSRGVKSSQSSAPGFQP